MTIVEMPSSRVIKANEKNTENPKRRANSRGNSQSSSDKMKPHRGTLLSPFYSSFLAAQTQKRNNGEGSLKTKVVGILVFCSIDVAYPVMLDKNVYDYRVRENAEINMSSFCALCQHASRRAQRETKILNWQ